MLHELKIKSNFLNDIISNKKTFEIRKDDRNFKVGDIISFIYSREDSYMFKGIYRYEIIYKLAYCDFPEGLKKDYCLLGIRKVKGSIL